MLLFTTHPAGLIWEMWAKVQGRQDDDGKTETEKLET